LQYVSKNGLIDPIQRGIDNGSYGCRSGCFVEQGEFSKTVTFTGLSDDFAIDNEFRGTLIDDIEIIAYTKSQDQSFVRWE
jgi:hypothetical protein